MSAIDSDSHQAIRELLSDLIERPVSESIKRSIEGPLGELSSNVDSVFYQQQESNKIARRLGDMLQDELSGLEERFNRDELVSLLQDMISGQKELSGKLNEVGSLILDKIDCANEEARIVGRQHGEIILRLSKLSYLNLFVLLVLSVFAAASLIWIQ